MKNHIFEQPIQTQPWLLHPPYFERLGEIAMYVNGIKPGLSAFVDEDDEDDWLPPQPAVQIQDGFALVPVKGVMIRNLRWYGVCDMALLERRVQALTRDESVHTVVFLVDSPGGQARGCAELAQMAEELSAVKRTVVWTEELCGSAAYYLAAACNEIYARPSAVVGSIGCYAAMLNVSAGMKKAGYELEAFTSAPGKLYGNAMLPMSAAAREFFQGQVEELGGEFRSFVEGRRPQASAEATGTGIYGAAGTWGTEMGLVDGTYLSLDEVLVEMLG